MDYLDNTQLDKLCRLLELNIPCNLLNNIVSIIVFHSAEIDHYKFGIYRSQDNQLNQLLDRLHIVPLNLKSNHLLRYKYYKY